MDSAFLITAFATLFVVIDPPGLVPLFGVAGYVIAGRLEKSDPQRFANMGANRA